MRVLSCYHVKQIGEQAANRSKSLGAMRDAGVTRYWHAARERDLLQEKNAAYIGVIAVTQAFFGRGRSIM